MIGQKAQIHLILGALAVKTSNTYLSLVFYQLIFIIQYVKQMQSQCKLLVEDHVSWGMSLTGKLAAIITYEVLGGLITLT